MFDGNFRKGVDQVTKPVGNGLVKMGISADHLTVMGLLMSIATAVSVGAGYLKLGVLLLILTALGDLLDGAVAKAAGTSSARGAFFDSVIDRVTDALLLGGIAWYLADTEGGRMPLLPMAVLGVSTVISYERAKAELLGFEAKGGLMERAERIFVLGFALFFDVILVPVLWGMLALTSLTAVQRFFKVWAQATEAHPAPSPRQELSIQRRRARRARRESRRTAGAGRTGRGRDARR